MTIHLLEPRSEHDWQQTRLLVEAYAASPDVGLPFQNFAHEREHLP